MMLLSYIFTHKGFVNSKIYNLNSPLHLQPEAPHFSQAHKPPTNQKSRHTQYHEENGATIYGLEFKSTYGLDRYT